MKYNQNDPIVHSPPLADSEGLPSTYGESFPLADLGDWSPLCGKMKEKDARIWNSMLRPRSWIGTRMPRDNNDFNVTDYNFI